MCCRLLVTTPCVNVSRQGPLVPNLVYSEKANSKLRTLDSWSDNELIASRSLSTRDRQLLLRATSVLQRKNRRTFLTVDVTILVPFVFITFPSVPQILRWIKSAVTPGTPVISLTVLVTVLTPP